MSGILPREDRTAAGVLVMAGAVALFTCIDTSAKWLALAGFAPLQIAFVRFAGHLVAALVILLPQEGLAAFRSRSPRLQILRSVFLMSSTILNFLALSYLPITLTTTIFFAMPVVVTLLAIPILGERVGPRRIAAVGTGFLGVIIVTQPWGAAWHPAIFFSLGALLVASLYFIMTRMLAGVDSNATHQIWPTALASLVLAPFALADWSWPAGALEWVVFCAIGLFGMTGHVAATIAHRWADASILSPLVYTQLFLAAFAGIVVFGTWPRIETLGGGAIIVASGLYIWQRERGRQT